MMKSRLKETREEEEDLDEIGYLIGSKGDLQYEKNKQKIKELDEQQEKLLDIHIKINSWSQGRVTKEKVDVLEKDIDCLWEKVRAYEEYATEERKLRIKAVEELRKHEKKLFGSVKDFDKDIFRDDTRQSRWSRPNIKMIRQGRPVAEEERDAKVSDLTQRGIKISQDFEEMIRLH